LQLPRTKTNHAAADKQMGAGWRAAGLWIGVVGHLITWNLNYYAGQLMSESLALAVGLPRYVIRLMQAPVGADMGLSFHTMRTRQPDFQPDDNAVIGRPQYFPEHA
jgi:hypothetical protein